MTEARDKGRAALVDALLRLLAERGVGDISVRDVAAAAGVNHGLVHRYFGSKEGLIREAAQRLSERIHQGDPVSGGMSAWSFEFLRAHPEVAVMVARLCLDGPHDVLEAAAPRPERLAEIVAQVERGLQAAGLGDVDAHLLNGLASAAFLGWFVFRPLLAVGFQLPVDADARLLELLRRLDALLGALAPAPAQAQGPPRGSGRV